MTSTSRSHDPTAPRPAPLDDARLVGRGRELSVIGGLFDTILDRGCALVVRGEAGIGKSSLLRAATADARRRGFQVVLGSGALSEAHLPYASLHQLLRRVEGRLDDLPAPQRSALRAAFGLADGAPAQPFLVGLGTLNLLADLATSAPVLVAIDQTEGLDPPTADVVAFLGRRLEADPIVLLAAIRDGLPSAVNDAGLPELRLRGLDDASSAAVLDAASPGLPERVRRRLLEDAAGNPLALTELPAALEPIEARGQASLPPRLRLTERLERSFASRTSALPSATRRLLLLAAADDGGDLAVLLAAASRLAGSPAPAAAIEPAIAAGLVALDGHAVRFRHPLVRSAIYQVATDAERRGAHAALAEALEDQPDRRIPHLAASTIGPDEAVAATLDAAARRAQQRGGVAAAVDALERAATLTPDAGRRIGRRLRAAELAFELGRGDMISRLLVEVDPADLTPLDQARVTMMRDVVSEGAIGHVDRVRSLIAAAEQAIAAGDSDLALNLLWGARMRSWRADPGGTVFAAILETTERVPGRSDDARKVAIRAPSDLSAHADVLARLRAPLAAGERDAAMQRFLAMSATSVGDFVLAEKFFVSAAAALRAQGRLAVLAQALIQRAWAARETHSLRTAAIDAEEGARLATETGQPLFAAGAFVTLAAVAAMRGEDDVAERYAQAVEERTVATEAGDVLADLQLVRGVAALGRGRHALALAHLARILDPSDAAFHPTTGTWATADYVEAAVLSGAEAAARTRFAEMEELAATTTSPRLQLAMLRARPWLAHDDDVDDRYREALAADMAGWPFVRGRLHLAYGEWLRRHRRVVEARAQLRIARDMFDAFGANAWGERARGELRASGEVSRVRTPDAFDRLTPQELQIARLAARGLSNREIADQLYLSHRTIGFHLYRVFPKLGITSRAELASALPAES